MKAEYQEAPQQMYPNNQIKIIPEIISMRVLRIDLLQTIFILKFKLLTENHHLLIPTIKT